MATARTTTERIIQLSVILKCPCFLGNKPPRQKFQVKTRAR
jgi:hypothetical protein